MNTLYLGSGEIFETCIIRVLVNVVAMENQLIPLFLTRILFIDSLGDIFVFNINIVMFPLDPLFPRVYPHKIVTNLGKQVKIQGFSDTSTQNLKWTFENGMLPSGVNVERLDDGLEITIVIQNVDRSHIGTYRLEYHDKQNHFILYDKSIVMMHDQFMPPEQSKPFHSGLFLDPRSSKLI